MGPPPPAPPSPAGLSMTEVRRPLGWSFVVSGLLSAVIMWGFALVLTGRKPMDWLSPEEWGNLFFGQFLVMFFGGAAAIYSRFVRTEPRLVQLLIDFLFGILAFKALGWGLDLVLRTSWGGAKMSWLAWVGIIPGLSLAAYGASLVRGRQPVRILEILLD